MAGQNLAAGGGNPSGFNQQQVAPVPGGGGGVMGDMGGYNPMMPQMPSNQQWPTLSSPYSFSANTGGSGAPAPMVNPMMGNMGGALGENLARGFRASGVPTNIAGSLADFLKSGAGYNPQVLQALIAQLQPQIQRGQADIMEQFGGMGLGQSSAGAIGMGDFMSQVNLNESQMATQLYEQAIQNYLQVMLGGTNYQNQQHQPGFWESFGENLLGKGVGALMGGVGSLAGGGGFGAGVSNTLGGPQ